ncbi:unnamed protein product [Protopolystoma xenopodis]|uniref:Uncharacterized protein n=1 Tax=Protopolystoma xenopodis TaxID=117903 RepID=A0A3S5BJB2_9PLAT|nr:unnamed protein product [Protopolystoma xenopodis]
MPEKGLDALHAERDLDVPVHQIGELAFDPLKARPQVAGFDLGLAMCFCASSSSSISSPRLRVRVRPVCGSDSARLPVDIRASHSLRLDYARPPPRLPIARLLFTVHQMTPSLLIGLICLSPSLARLFPPISDLSSGLTTSATQTRPRLEPHSRFCPPVWPGQGSSARPRRPQIPARMATGLFATHPTPRHWPTCPVSAADSPIPSSHTTAMPHLSSAAESCTGSSPHTHSHTSRHTPTHGLGGGHRHTCTHKQAYTHPLVVVVVVVVGAVGGGPSCWRTRSVLLQDAAVRVCKSDVAAGLRRRDAKLCLRKHPARPVNRLPTSLRQPHHIHRYEDGGTVHAHTNTHTHMHRHQTHVCICRLRDIRAHVHKYLSARSAYT